MGNRDAHVEARAAGDCRGHPAGGAIEGVCAIGDPDLELELGRQRAKGAMGARSPKFRLDGRGGPADIYTSEIHHAVGHLHLSPLRVLPAAARFSSSSLSLDELALTESRRARYPVQPTFRVPSALEPHHNAISTHAWTRQRRYPHLGAQHPLVCRLTVRRVGSQRQRRRRLGMRAAS